MEIVCCPLCQRPIAQPASLHHLLPLAEGGRNTETVLLHQICHDKIHATFSERELAKFYNTIEALIADERIQKFIKWVRRQPPQFYDRTKRANGKYSH